jgi:hypothetical protein
MKFNSLMERPAAEALLASFFAPLVRDLNLTSVALRASIQMRQPAGVPVIAFCLPTG